MMFGLQMINEMENFHREMDQLLCGLGIGSTRDHQTMSSDIKLETTERGYRVTVNLPGIDAEKLEIDILGRRLTLSADMAEPDSAEDVIWHRRERAKMPFKKALTLPDEIDSDQIEAEYNNGILSISLPKAASALPKKISVKAA